MKVEDFEGVLESSLDRSRVILTEKASEYASDGDRLANFKQAAGALEVNPMEALVAFMTKHYVSVVKMSRNPHIYPLPMWNEKLGDLRNYTILADALVRDMREPGEDIV